MKLAPVQKKPKSLRTRMTQAILLPLAVVLIIVTVIEYNRNRSEQLANALVLGEAAGQSLERTVRQHLLRSNFSGIEEMMRQMSQSGELKNVYLRNESGAVLNSSADMTGRFLSYDSPDCQSCHPARFAIRPTSIVIKDESGAQMLRAAYPLENAAECATCHGTGQATLGMLITDVPLAPLQDRFASNLRANLFWWFASFGAVFLGVFVVLDRQIVSRLANLAWSMNTFDPHSFAPLSDDGESDEIADLYHSFNDMALSVQQHEQENEMLTAQLSQENEQRAELLKRMIDAQENERKRIAAELHDELGQVLTGVTMQLEAIKRTVERDPARGAMLLSTVQEHVALGVDKMYEVIIALRPSELDDLGLVPALRNLIERVLAGTNISYELNSCPLQERLPAAVETALYRTFQEALNNIVRHSGATHIQLSIELEPDCLRGRIVDNGCGFEPESLELNGSKPRGLGLLGMKERVGQCCGQVTVRSQPGEGTVVEIEVPLTEMMQTMSEELYE